LANSDKKRRAKSEYQQKSAQYQYWPVMNKAEGAPGTGSIKKKLYNHLMVGSVFYVNVKYVNYIIFSILECQARIHQNAVAFYDTGRQDSDICSTRFPSTVESQGRA
jgi:hypothetical protein